MRRCTRCRCWKPDACFLTKDIAYMPGRCAHCRSILKEMRASTGKGGQVVSKKLPEGPEKVLPTPEARALAAAGVAERLAWEARGARKVPRTYLHDARGGLVGRRTRAKRYDGGFTSATLGR